MLLLQGMYSAEDILQLHDNIHHVRTAFSLTDCSHQPNTFRMLLYTVTAEAFRKIIGCHIVSPASCMRFFPDTGASACAKPSKHITQGTHSASLECLQLLVLILLCLADEVRSFYYNSKHFRLPGWAVSTSVVCLWQTPSWLGKACRNSSCIELSKSSSSIRTYPAGIYLCDIV